jgi:prepilin peptidase CpaA
VGRIIVPTLEFSVSLIAGAAAVFEDLRRRQIPNWIPVFALISGLVLHVTSAGPRGLLTAGAGAACGFGVFLLFYILGGMGGGDVKLMAGMGAILGPSRLMSAAWWAAMIGAVLALGAIGVIAARRGNWRKASIPYAPAIAGGALLALTAGGTG